MSSCTRLAAGSLVVAATSLGMASGAGAVTVSLTNFDAFSRSDLAGAQAAGAAFEATNSVKHVETFDNIPAGTTNPAGAGYGSFTAYGDAGSGSSVVGSGRDLQVRGDNSMRWGRFNMDPNGGLLGGNWLDSNDNTGITWTISGVGQFNALGFFVTVIADVGGKFSITAGDTVFSNLAGASGKLANGNVHFVSLLLDEMVDEFTLTLAHDGTNDGFGIDGAMVAVAPVPLPPAAALMLGGMGLLGALGWRRRASGPAAAA